MAKKSTKAAAKAAAPATTTKTKVTVSTTRKKTPKQMLDILLIAACLVLSVIVVVLSISHSIDPHTATLTDNPLTIGGLFCYEAAAMQRTWARCVPRRKVQRYLPGTYTTSAPSLPVLAMRLLRMVRLRMSVALMVRRVAPSATLTILRPLLPLA